MATITPTAAQADTIDAMTALSGSLDDATMASVLGFTDDQAAGMARVARAALRDREIEASGDVPNTERLMTVKLAFAFATRCIALDRDLGHYVVEAIELDHTSRGAHVGGTIRRVFTDLDDARAVANTWFTRWVAAGWTRTG
ncbi:MAG TPA: hypothetical protein VGL93_10440 [Streptosporangiaceae bacterium]|jgi:hypothetical protein